MNSAFETNDLLLFRRATLILARSLESKVHPDEPTFVQQ